MQTHIIADYDFRLLISQLHSALDMICYSPEKKHWPWRDADVPTLLMSFIADKATHRTADLVREPIRYAANTTDDSIN